MKQDFLCRFALNLVQFYQRDCNEAT